MSCLTVDLHCVSCTVSWPSNSTDTGHKKEEIILHLQQKMHILSNNNNHTKQHNTSNKTKNLVKNGQTSAVCCSAKINKL